MRKLQGIWALFLILALALVACGPKGTATPAPSPSPAPSPAPAPAPQLSDWDKVLAAAKKEGSLTIYSTSANQVLEAAKEPMSKLGIKVETVGGGGNELMSRITTEQRAKTYTADLLHGGYTTPLLLLEEKFTQPVTAALPSLADKSVFITDSAKYEPTNNVFMPGMGLTPSIIVNTDLVRPGEITSWQDLLDPKWKDKMVMTDPRSSSGPGVSGIWAWMGLGEDFWKKLAAQRPILQANPEVPTQQISYGDKSVAIFPNFLRVTAAIRAGAPAKIVHLKEGTSYYVTGIGIVKNAPHPNAAMVFINWMFSKEGQVAIGKSSQVFSIRKDLNNEWMGSIPELNRATFKLLEPPNDVDLAGPKTGLEFATKIFGAR